MSFDELGQRMKVYESQTTGIRLMPGLPVYARIDGRAFHTFCRGLSKPFCGTLVETMHEVTKFLVDKTHAALGYTQSDEISLCWLDLKEAPFEGKLFKLESVLASMTASKFVSYIGSKSGCGQEWELLNEKCKSIIPSFDCRVFQLPNESELANVFVWRQMDAVRNSIQAVAQAHFSHKELMNRGQKEMLTMLEGKNIRWNELPQVLKSGAYFKKFIVAKELSDSEWESIPVNKRPESRVVLRASVQCYDIPEIKNVENKVGVYFYGEEPKYKVSTLVSEEEKNEV